MSAEDTRRRIAEIERELTARREETEARERKELEAEVEAALKAAGMVHVRHAMAVLRQEGRIERSITGTASFRVDGATLPADLAARRWVETDEGRVFVGREAAGEPPPTKPNADAEEVLANALTRRRPQPDGFASAVVLGGIKREA